MSASFSVRGHRGERKPVPGRGQDLEMREGEHGNQEEESLHSSTFDVDRRQLNIHVKDVFCPAGVMQGLSVDL